MKSAANPRSSFWLLVLVLASACHKNDAKIIPFEQAYIPMATTITSVWMTDELHGLASGGTSWEVGYLLATSDGGLSWAITDTLRHKMECVMADSSGYAHAVGQSGICCEKPPGRSWIKYREDYRWHRSCFMLNQHKGLIASGESFGEGEIRLYGPEVFWQLDTLFAFPNQLQSVWASDADNWHACGLGWVLHSADGGHSWTRKAPTDDFFTDIHFPTPETGYICGSSGTLLKTHNGGKDWAVIREGGSFGRRKQPFNAVWFSSPTEGWLAGDGGLLWYTSDGGQQWSTIGNIPAQIDLTEIYGLSGRIWVSGTQGTVLMFEL